MTGCKSLKSLSNDITLSQSLKFLSLIESGLNELPPSVFLARNLICIAFSINDALLDLPKNFIRVIMLCETFEFEGDSFFILQKALRSPGFLSVRCLMFYKCQRLCKIPDNISLLSSLDWLTLEDCTIVSLPESIKYLPRLRKIEIFECGSLQCIPALPQSIQTLFVWMCESLHTVLCSTIEPSKKPEYNCLLQNCVKLDEHTHDAILKDAIVRIEHAAKPPPAQVLENEQDCLDESAKISYSLPATSDKVLDWLHWRFKSAQALVPIEQVPPNLLGFIFYLVVPPVQSHHVGCCKSIGCECYLETNEGERINITSFFLDHYFYVARRLYLFEFMTDHIFLWYDEKLCKQIMEVIKERKASNSGDLKLTFKFFTETQYNKEAVIIKECGFRWIYYLEEGGCKSKRSRECSESSDQEETLPPTKKLKSRTSNLEEEEETEELLRHRLEELLLHSI